MPVSLSLTSQYKGYDYLPEVCQRPLNYWDHVKQDSLISWNKNLTLGLNAKHHFRGKPSTAHHQDSPSLQWSIMVAAWYCGGCLSAACTGKLIWIAGKMWKKYTNILDEHLLQRTFRRLGCRFTLLPEYHSTQSQANSGCDRSVNVLEWPSSEPGL